MAPSERPAPGHLENPEELWAVLPRHDNSPMELYDAASECRHGKLPVEPCAACKRTTDVPHPGRRLMVLAERAFIARADDR